MNNATGAVMLINYTRHNNEAILDKTNNNMGGRQTYVIFEIEVTNYDGGGDGAFCSYASSRNDPSSTATASSNGNIDCDCDCDRDCGESRRGRHESCKIGFVMAEELERFSSANGHP
jgi:hypothetical protein